MIDFYRELAAKREYKKTGYTYGYSENKIKNEYRIVIFNNWHYADEWYFELPTENEYRRILNSKAAIRYAKKRIIKISADLIS